MQKRQAPFPVTKQQITPRDKCNVNAIDSLFIPVNAVGLCHWRSKKKNWAEKKIMKTKACFNRLRLKSIERFIISSGYAEYSTSTEYRNNDEKNYAAGFFRFFLIIFCCSAKQSRVVMTTKDKGVRFKYDFR